MSLWYPFSSPKNLNLMKIVRAEKEFLYDENGKEYIDAVSSWWTCIYGHRHPGIVGAVKKQLDEIDHVMLAGFTHEPVLALSDKLLQFTDNNFHKVFYSDNGSTAVEVALKIALQYFYNRGEKDKKNIIHFSEAYHGDTAGAMSVGGKSIFNEPFSGVMFQTQEIEYPNCSNCPYGDLHSHCSTECMEPLDEYLLKNSKQTAAIIIEPLLMGAGGMKIYKPEILSIIRKLCNTYDVIMIHDEVFTGYGRTGKKFAYEHAGIIPDIMAIAKGMTGGASHMGATLASKKIFTEFDSEESAKIFYHGHTMTGNPVASAAALASLEIFESENILGKVNLLQKQFNGMAKVLQQEFPELILNARVLGAVLALDIQSDVSGYLSKVGQLLRENSLKDGIIIRPLGNCLYIAPPYTISNESLEKIYISLRNSLKLLNEKKLKI